MFHTSFIIFTILGYIMFVLSGLLFIWIIIKALDERITPFFYATRNTLRIYELPARPLLLSFLDPNRSLKQDYAEYSWDDLEQVMFTQTFRTKSQTGKRKKYTEVIILVMKISSPTDADGASPKYLKTSPEGWGFIGLSFLKKESEKVFKKLEYFARGRVGFERYREIVFDDREGKEVYIT